MRRQRQSIPGHSLGNELGSVVRPDEGRWSSQNEHVRQHVDHIDGVGLPIPPDHQALPRVLIDEVQGSEDPPVMGPVMNKIV